MADCSYCGEPVGFGQTRCNTETCYLQHIAKLGEQLAAVTAKLAESERENAAWRALVVRESAGYHWMPPRQLASDAWTTTGSTLLNDAALPLPPAFGQGDTPQAAAIDLATKLGLLADHDAKRAELAKLENK